MMKTDPRLLIISNNPLSQTQHNGKTLESFVKGWDESCIAQLFFKEEEPSFQTCKRFFRVTDRDMLKQLLIHAPDVGRVISPPGMPSGSQGMPSGSQGMPSGPQSIDPTGKSKTVSMGSRGNPLFTHAKSWDSSKLIRELIWRKKHWKRRNLLSWLEELKPEIILFCGGDSIFAYDITRCISDLYHARIIFYVTDDYVTSKFSLSPFFHLRLFWLKKRFSSMLRQCSQFITIGEKMSREYALRFGRKSTVAMNCLQILPAVIKGEGKTLKLMYFGGLHYNRWKTLAVLGRALNQYNADGMKRTLDIYSRNRLTRQMEKSLHIGDSCRFSGGLDENGVKEKIVEADILVHVEAFDKKSMHATRLSVSSKIPEYMAANRVILGIGPSNLASIEYIAKFAYVVSSQSEHEIVEALHALLSDSALREKLAADAYGMAKENHDIFLVAKKFRAIVDGPEERG